MTQCPHCKGTDIQRARNDCGHFKSDKQQPIRMYQYRCAGCGYVATFAREGEKP